MMSSLKKRVMICAFCIHVFQTSAAADESKRRSFQEWCEDKSISVEARRTVDELLLVAKSKNCSEAQAILKKQKGLNLAQVYGPDARKVIPFGPQPEKHSPCDMHSGCDAALSPSRRRNISDLGPLEFFTWLESLNLNLNQISDLRPILHFRNLKTFSIRRNPLQLEKCPFPAKPKFQCNFH